MWKNKKSRSQYSRSPSRNLNPQSHKYEAVVLTASLSLNRENCHEFIYLCIYCLVNDAVSNSGCVWKKQAMS
jgi:hypothetical protein